MVRSRLPRRNGVRNFDRYQHVIQWHVIEIKMCKDLGQRQRRLLGSIDDRSAFVIASAGQRRGRQFPPGRSRTEHASSGRQSKEHAVIDPDQFFLNGGRILRQDLERALVVEHTVRLIEPGVGIDS